MTTTTTTTTTASDVAASRVGTLLRQILNESAPTHNHVLPSSGWAARLAARRAKQWQRQAPVSQIMAASTPGAQQSLTWQSFTAGVHDRTKRADAALLAIRPRFTHFWEVVREISGASTPDALAQSAFVMYKAAISEKVAARKALERYFGKIRAAVYVKLVTVTKELHEWQTKYAPQALADTMTTAAAATVAASKQPPAPPSSSIFHGEYGASMKFTSPFGGSDGDDDWRDSDEDEEKTSASSTSSRAEAAAEAASGSTVALELSLDPDRCTSSVEHSHTPGEFNDAWLHKRCEAFVSVTDTGETLISGRQLADSLTRLLQSPQSDDALQGEVLNLIGFHGLDFVSMLIQHRQCVVGDLRAGANRRRQPLTGGGGGDKPTLVGVSVRRADQMKETQSQRRERRRMMRQSQHVDGASPPAAAASSSAGLAPPSSIEGGAIGGTGVKRGIVLPAGSTRVHKVGYEEVYVPPVMPSPLQHNTLIPVSSMPEVARRVFNDIKHLNRMQSQVYECALNTSHNMLVCAPTGAGKTNVAMLSVLREVQMHTVDGVLQKDVFKVVYVAPMKALAQEVQQKFQSKLNVLGMSVRELTGDMQLTKREIRETQMLVTTPEKWDVVTRKSGDGALMDMVTLLIIDEVHLLHEDRGPVIEILVARTLRQVERSQKMCRIVGLSATLPNHADVAAFIHANPKEGMFFFGNEYRPVPLTQYYIGVTYPSQVKCRAAMNDLTSDKMVASVKEGNQVMVFVHSRRDTVKTAEFLAERVAESDASELFLGDYHTAYGEFKSKVTSCRNQELKSLLPKGFGVHHAGMTRPDRNLVERAFKRGVLQVIVCTATLAWGVNLPAHTVIIKGTKIYDAKRGGFVELGMLDVMQIFGRAGRPQFDTTGEGIIITEHAQLNHYLSLINHQMPIESQFIEQLPDHLNAEITLGTVTNMTEAMAWLQYTYLYVRMLRNPMAYGITNEEKNYDPMLVNYRRKLIMQAVEALKTARMCRYHEQKELFGGTHLGRVASHYYIHHETIETFNKRMESHVNDETVCDMIANCREFEQLKTREEERDEMNRIAKLYCPVPIKGPLDSNVGKANLLLQAYISNGHIRESTLMSDLYYITQNAGRIARALFEISLKMGDANLAAKLLEWCKMIDLRIWSFQHPLRQFRALKLPLVEKLEAAHVDIYRLGDMSLQEIGSVIRHQTMATQVKRYCRLIPQLCMEATVQPITREVLRVTLLIDADFDWQTKLHGTALQWWVWCEDPGGVIYHHESFNLKHQQRGEQHRLEFTIPIHEPLPPQYYVRVINDRWMGAENTLCLSFKHLFLPSHRITHTPLLNLHPIPVTALHNPSAEAMYPFTHFNPVQTQCFHTMFHTDENVLMGAPTGSGKTIIGELAILRLLSLNPHQKVVYVAPMKALARERVRDWNASTSLRGRMGCRVVELTGDSAPDARTLAHANVIITTPEKWDGVSRSWRAREYVRHVGLVLIDEIHLLGQDRGPVLEVIVSRMRHISAQTDNNVRIVGLSTALSNANDVADWLGIERMGLFNFEPKARPVPLTIHVSGYPGQHYCPRMATMNKPTYAAITNYSPNKPVLVFVSSRRQTRLTALDLINYTAGSGDPHKFLHLAGGADSAGEMDRMLARVRDPNLRHCLAFGIGMHHAGLAPTDRALVEDLFVSRRIQVLVCTATLAWGVNFPAYLVVVKGTEYFDGKQGRYVDFPITDVLQMMGRAGRPQYDQDGVACVLVHEPKKNFYLKFLHHPFPVESSLHLGVNLHNTFNAEVVAGTVASVHDAIMWLSWTFYFRRLLVNPTYYGFTDPSVGGVTDFLATRVRTIFFDLQRAGCIRMRMDNDDDNGGDGDGGEYVPREVSADLDRCVISGTALGKVASFYYVAYTSVHMFRQRLLPGTTIEQLVAVLANASEYDELPVRHNEDVLNGELAKQLPWPVAHPFDSSHCKANLLFQAHFNRVRLPITDYITDTHSVLDQAMRVLQAMMDVCADAGHLHTALRIVTLVQMIVQGCMHTDAARLSFLPSVTDRLLARRLTLPQLMHDMHKLPRDECPKALVDAVNDLPRIRVEVAAHSGGGGGVDVRVRVVNRRGPPSGKVRISKLGKNTTDGWFVVVGVPATDQLLALKRVTLRKHDQTVRLRYAANGGGGGGDDDVCVYVMSDSYLGLDHRQQVSPTTDDT